MADVVSKLKHSNRAVTTLWNTIICDWIYGNHSKSHIGSYEIIDFKDFNAL